jgi:hypothetical protein
MCASRVLPWQPQVFWLHTCTYSSWTTMCGLVKTKLTMSQLRPGDTGLSKYPQPRRQHSYMHPVCHTWPATFTASSWLRLLCRALFSWGLFCNAAGSDRNTSPLTVCADSRTGGLVWQHLHPGLQGALLSLPVPRDSPATPWTCTRQTPSCSAREKDFIVRTVSHDPFSSLLLISCYKQ